MNINDSSEMDFTRTWVESDHEKLTRRHSTVTAKFVIFGMNSAHNCTIWFPGKLKIYLCGSQSFSYCAPSASSDWSVGGKIAAFLCGIPLFPWVHMVPVNYFKV